MNYYERHIGDYLKDTAHLSLLEHGVYGRLLDVYYTREAPIPAGQVERLIGVRSREEREALRNVLQEFFQADGEVLRHGRCDREIERFQHKQRKAAASANARWKKDAPQSERSADAMRTHMRTHCEGNAPNHQTPDTSKASASVEHQQPGAPPFGPDGPARADFEAREPGAGQGSGPGSGGVSASAGPPGGAPPGRPGLAVQPGSPAAVEAFEAMRSAGLADASATHPGLCALLAAGITVAELAEAARVAAQRGRGFTWALGRAEGQRRDAAAVAPLPDAAPAVDPDSRGAIEADGVRLGLGAWEPVDAQGRTVHWPAYAARVKAARADRAAQGSEVAA